jgi:hypothetical protein
MSKPRKPVSAYKRIMARIRKADTHEAVSRAVRSVDRLRAQDYTVEEGREIVDYGQQRHREIDEAEEKRLRAKLAKIDEEIAAKRQSEWWKR